MTDFLINLNKTYSLSNSGPVLHHEKGIVNTPLGECFNKECQDRLGLNVITSHLAITEDGTICLTLKIRDFPGSNWGIISTQSEPDVSTLRKSSFKTVWKAFSDSVAALQLPSLTECVVNGVRRPYSLSITMINFDEFSGMGFFQDNIARLQEATHAAFPDISFILQDYRGNEHVYRIIFKDEAEQQKASEQYGFQAMIDFVWQFCLREDDYGVFLNCPPIPEITNKTFLVKSHQVLDADFDQL